MRGVARSDEMCGFHGRRDVHANFLFHLRGNDGFVGCRRGL